jgi:hypothetical protein
MTSKANVSWLKRLTTRLAAIEAGSTVVNSGTDTPISITAEQALAGITVTNLGATGAVEFDLPAAEVGMKVTAHVIVAQNLALDPNGTEKIFNGALADIGAGTPCLANAIGESATFECLKAGQWNVTKSVGTWDADGTP